MKGTMSAATAHKQYTEIVTAYRRIIADPTLRARFGREIDDFVRTCALGVWQADDTSQISPRHVEFYNAIYSPGSNSPMPLSTPLPGFRPGPKRSNCPTPSASSTASTPG